LFDVGDVGSMAEITLNDFASISAPKAQVKIGANLAGWIGGAKGTVTLNGSAAFTTGNTVLVGEGKGDATTAAEGVINLNGGTFTAPALVTGDTSIAATINFNGGTLQACVPNGVLYYTDIGITMTANGAADFIQGSNFAVNVMENGAKIDTNALDITINRELKHAGTLPLDGGLTKLGDGSLTLTVLPTYTGDTNVNQGLLNANAGISTPNSRVYVATGATLNATSIVADTLTIGGPQIGAAVAVPEPGTLVLLVLAGMGILLAVWRRK
jgi:autotransporter-associated beta strand protein